MKQILFVFIVACVFFSRCYVLQPKICGTWETVTSIDATKWIYTFDDDGQMCREMLALFDVRFCNDYAITSRSGLNIELTIERRDVEFWSWSFVDNEGDIADVTMKQDSTTQRFILKRLK